MSKLTFDNNWANYGGTIYIEGASTTILSELNVVKSRAATDGGFIYAKETTVVSVIIKVNTVPVNIKDSQAVSGNGGAVYIDAPNA